MATSSSPSTASSRVGQGLLTVGLGGLVLLALAAANALPAAWQWRITANAPAWGTGSLALMVTGIGLLRSVRQGNVHWSPSVPGQRFSSLVIYLRQDCGLCDDAAELLAHYRSWLPPAIEVDLDELEDAVLQARYHLHIPVVELDGRVRFKGRVNELLLRRLIEGTPPEPDLRQR